MIKRSVSLAITDDARPGDVLLVQRPSDDDELPDVWGLPAASLRDDESWADAARRAARDKLGIEVDIGAVLEDGNCERASYQLQMRLLHATIRQGLPAVPQPHADVTQYQSWRWGAIAELRRAADCGSLCAQLCLDWHNKTPRGTPS